MKYSRLFQI